MGESADRDDEDAKGGIRGTANFVAGMVLGALIGAGIAMLVAPAEGSVLRKRLGRQARELGERAREGLDDAAHRARRDLARRRRRLQARLDRLAEEARDSIPDLP
jgi:gas vesicle protein